MPDSGAKRLTDHQVVRFIFSAGCGFLVDVITFHVLHKYILAQPVYHAFGLAVRNSSLAFTISYCLGVVTNFTVTKYAVFHESTTPGAQQFTRFISVAFVGYFANLGLLKLMIQVIHLHPTAARITAALSLFAASFFVHKLFSFSLSLRKHHTHETQPDHQPGN